jgi:hypothetical protein
MNILTGRHGVKLAAPSFHPSQLPPRAPVAPKKANRTRPKISNLEAVRRVLPTGWTAASTILQAANVAPSARNYSLVKQLVLSGEVESRIIERKGGDRMQYRKAKATRLNETPARATMARKEKPK